MSLKYEPSPEPLYISARFRGSGCTGVLAEEVVAPPDVLPSDEDLFRGGLVFKANRKKSLNSRLESNKEEEEKKICATLLNYYSLMGDRLRDAGRGTTRAKDAQGTPTQSHISPSIPVYKDYSSNPFAVRCVAMPFTLQGNPIQRTTGVPRS